MDMLLLASNMNSEMSKDIVPKSQESNNPLYELIRSTFMTGEEDKGEFVNI